MITVISQLMTARELWLHYFVLCVISKAM